MKKILTIALCVLLLIAMAIPVSAAGTASLSRSETEVNRGEKFTITVSVSNVAASKSGSIEVTVDNKFTIVSGEWLISGTIMKDFDAAQKDGVFAFDSEKKISGKVFKLTLKAKSDAEFASGNISVKLSFKGESSDITKSTSVKVVCKHSYKYTNDSATKHVRTCSICKESEKLNHTYDNACDTSCNDCKAKRTTSHSYLGTLASDATGHWYPCEHCGDKKEFAAHSPGPAATEGAAQTCTACGFEINAALPHEHVYTDKFSSDGEGHKPVCDTCQQPGELAEHTFDSDCDDVCDVCKYQRQVQHAVDGWEMDQQTHWQSCGDCGQKIHLADHTWGDGVVTQEPTANESGLRCFNCTECGMVRAEIIPATNAAPGNLSWWVWLIIGCGGGVLLTAAVGMLIILPLTKKTSRKKAKFSN